MRLRPYVAALALPPLLLAGCGGGDAASSTEGDDGRVQVLAAFYPFEFVAERVGGDLVEVENLTKPGAEPHDVELTPRQVGAVADADLVVYLEGFQPAVDDAVEQNPPSDALEVSEVVPLGGDAEHAAGEDAGDGDAAGEDAGDEHAADEHADDEHATDEHAADGHGHDLAGDPHLWLDPTKLATVTEAVADRLAQADPPNAETYRSNAEALVEELTALDEELATGLADCERDVFVTSHTAFGHLAERYGLEQVGITGLSPEAEPSPRRIQEVHEVVEREGITTIFYETLVNPDVAETMAADLGVRTAVLDPLEGLTDDASGDYLSVMRANLAALQQANGCR